jgi:hypothetical protein
VIESLIRDEDNNGISVFKIWPNNSRFEFAYITFTMEKEMSLKQLISDFLLFEILHHRVVSTKDIDLFYIDEIRAQNNLTVKILADSSKRDPPQNALHSRLGSRCTK